MAISISIKRKRIFILASIAIPWNKSACWRIVISCPQINSSSFLVIVLTTITERICIVLINVILNAESVILVSLSYFAIGICEINNIAMSILGIVGIFWLIAVSVVVLCNKICATNITILYLYTMILTIFFCFFPLEFKIIFSNIFSYTFWIGIQII